MTSPVSRERLDAIRAAYDGGTDTRPVWVDDLADLLAAATYALDADDRIAALEAEVERLRRALDACQDDDAEMTGIADDLLAERDALARAVAAVRALHQPAEAFGLCGPYLVCDYDNSDYPCPTVAALGGVTVPDDPRIAEVRALCEEAYARFPIVHVADVLAILDREAP